MNRNCLFLWGLLVLLSGCATWHNRTAAFQTAVAKGEFEEADRLLHKDKQMARSKNRILFCLNQGYVDFMLNRYKESNAAFEQAEILMDKIRRNPAAQAAALLSNPETLPYKPEDFEVILVNFYKAMNYLQMDQMEEALVEVRKINIKLNELNDKYPDYKNRYQRDAFAHLLMGQIYEASGNYNDAFIAYRNAYETYQSDYVKNFGLGTPLQLKYDLLRMASLCGFTSELRQYETESGLTYQPEPIPENGELILFWLNGLGPVKSERSLEFVKQKGEGGAVVFHNAEYGLTFPFFWSSGYSEKEKNSLADLKVVRVAFPQYVERPSLYTYGTVRYDNSDYPFEVAEDINQIAFKTLHDRMVREMATSLLRLAAKQGVEYAASRQNEWLGLAVGLVNAFTEKADTRNWQTLPNTISYIRIPLKSAENTLDLHFTSPKGQSYTEKITVEGRKKFTRFRVFSTL